MGLIRSFRDLDAWSSAMDLVIATYRVCNELPASEQFGLRAQMKRAATSVPSNIAEGHAGGAGRRFRQYLRIALGSLAELDTQLEIARRLEYIDSKTLQEIAQQVTRTRQLLHGLHRSLRMRAALGALAFAAVLSGCSTLLLS